MFDAFLRERAARATTFSRVRRGRRLRRATSTASRATTACARSSRRAGSSCRRASRTTRRTPRRSRARQPQERARAADDPRATASRSTRARCATCEAVARRRPAPRGRVLERQQPRRCSRSRGIERPVRGARRRRRRRARGHLAGKPAPDMFLGGRAALGVEPAQAAVFEDALAGVEAGRAGGFGCVVGVDRVGQADALREHGADVVVADLAELLRARDRTPRSRSSRGAVRETELDLDVLAQTESVFALSNGHIGLRGNLDEGEPHGLPGHLPERLLRDAPAAVRRGRLRLSGGRPDGRQRHQRQVIRLLVDDEPFDVRYGELRAPRARARLARRRAAPRGRVELAGRRSVRVQLDPAGLVRAARGRGDPVRGRAARRVRCASSCSRELVANEPRARAAKDPRAAAALEAPLSAEESRAPRAAGRARALDQAQRAADGRGHGPRRSTGPRARHGRPRAATDLGRVTVTADLAARRAAARRQVPRLRLVEPALAAGAARPGRRRRWRRRATPAGTGWSTAQRAYLDDFWERADVELEGDAELQQAVRFALFHMLQAGARAERRAIPAKGLTGPATTGTPSGTPRPSCCRVLTYTVPRRRRRRAALAPLDARPGARARPARWGSRAPRSRGGRSAGRSARATGRRAPPPSTSTPTSPTP